MTDMKNRRTAWECKIGSINGVTVPPCADAPMRAAVQDAFRNVTGEEAQVTFSGWGAEFTPQEIAVIKNDGSWPAEVPTFDYVAEANVTASHEWHGEMVNFFFFKAVLTNAIGALQVLDKYKKTLFYGRDTGLPMPDRVESMANMLATSTEHQIVHAIIGSATEAGEKLEQLYAWATGKIKHFDKINLVEETGDGQWYDALLADALGVTFDEIQRINIAKLRARYKDKFDAFDANNRELEFERGVLEVGAGLTSIAHDQAAAAVTGLPGLFDPLPGTMMFGERKAHAATVAAGVEAFRKECQPAEHVWPGASLQSNEK
jgi:hypothetical protein